MAAEIRRIAKALPVRDDGIPSVSHASWLETEAATLEKAGLLLVEEQRAAA